MCSPYLTGSLALMLVLVTFNYWSVSTNNFDLVKEVKMMQTQLKTGSGTIQDKERDVADLREELKTVRQSLEKCKGEKATLESVKESLKICNTDKQTCEREKVADLEQARKEAKKVKDTLLNKSQKLTEEKEVVERRSKELEEELEGAKSSLKDLEGEVASLRAEQLKSKDRPAIRLTGGGGDIKEEGGSLGRGQLPDVNPKAVSVVQKETRGSASADDHLHPVMAPRHLPPGPSSPKPRGISSSSSVKSVGLVDNVGGVMPPPNNLDQAEDDAQIPLHKNGPDGKIMLEDDDQDPNGQIDETVDPEKQQFLQDKAIKAETKDIVVEGKEEKEENNIDHPVISSESLKLET